MHLCIKIFFFCFLSISSTVFADQLIIEPEMGRTPIINMINDTKFSLDLVMYGFTDDVLLQPILTQIRHGKTVKIILERAPYKNEKENRKIIQAFKNQKAAWLGRIPPYRLIHQKTLIIDNKKALVMTFNFTKSTFKHERNFGLVIDDEKKVRAIKRLFEADWHKRALFENSPDLIISPEDSRKKILGLIKQAKRSLKIYAQSISDYKVIGELAKASKRNVKVIILTSRNLRPKQEKYLSKAGVTIQHSKNFYIHAKVIIVDEKLALLGSINLTRASLDDNRELAILTKDANVLKDLIVTFDADFNLETAPVPHVNWLYDKKTRWQAVKRLISTIH